MMMGRAAGSRSRVESLVERVSSSSILDKRDAAVFQSLMERWAMTKVLDWAHIAPPPPDLIKPLDGLEAVPGDQKLQMELLNKVVILKLNGGLGLGMGCKMPKSTIEVRQGRTFLDLIVRQVEYLNISYGVDVPLVLMNSFQTHDQTMSYLQKYQTHNIRIHTFVQNSYPRLHKTTLEPMPTKPFHQMRRGPAGPDEAQFWYPPGHGDIYQSLFQSGLLDEFIKQGKEYIFISNVDNLGATVDLRIMYHLMCNEVEFAIEVTEKTRADVRGGTLVAHKGQPRMVEHVQVPRDHVDEFKKVSQFSFFNTNNMWINLRGIQRLVASGEMQTDVLVYEKKARVGGIDLPCIQLETSAASAMHLFKSSMAIHVPRARFLPVKTTSDLFSVRSNLYKVKFGSLTMNPAREIKGTPIIKLGPSFQSVDAFLERVGETEYHNRDEFVTDAHEEGKVSPCMPDIVALEHLTLQGNIFFGKGVVLRGTVIIVADEGARVDIPGTTVLVRLFAYSPRVVVVVVGVVAVAAFLLDSNSFLFAACLALTYVWPCFTP